MSFKQMKEKDQNFIHKKLMKDSKVRRRLETSRLAFNGEREITRLNNISIIESKHPVKHLMLRTHCRYDRPILQT